MTEAAVELVLNNLKELVAHRSLLIGDNSGHIVRLLRDVLEINAFLKDSRTVEKRMVDDEPTKEIVKEIHEVVNEVEDIIDVFVNKTMAPNNSEINNSEIKNSEINNSEIKNRKISLSRKLLKILLNLHTVGKKLDLHTAGETVDLHTAGETVDLHTVGEKVEKVRKSAQQAMGDTGIVKLKAEHKSQQSQDRLRRKKHVVGFEDKADGLINSLTRDSDFLLGISIIGMPGLGKTTLARKVYNDFRIIDKFPIRIWLSISQEFSERDTFLSILKQLYTPTITNEMESKEGRELAELTFSYLDSAGDFLIVMDDVWEPNHWRRLEVALPKNNKGKVLITSRSMEVGYCTNSSILKLDFLSDKKSWKLLRLEALHTLDCPPDLENVGRTIASNCMGWPFLVVIIGGILATKSKDPNAMKEKWEKVSMKVMSSCLNEDDMRYPIGNIVNFISLSYYDLSYHLRSCFLYMGMFSEDYEIPASKLIRMWIGEGFIQHSESCSLEETAEQYLEELIRRNLVKSEKFKYDGKVKTCRIHGLFYEFCQYEAAKERLLKQIKYDSGIFTTSNNDMNEYRRLSIHSNCKSFISSKPYCPHARSFVCFSEDKYVVSKQNSSNFFAAFKFLKVLDVEPFRFEEIDTDIYQLVYMRYLVLSSNLSVFRSEFSQLWNIQTLIIHTTSPTLEVKADIWKMSKLRYFKTNASANLPKPSKISTYGKELQRLGTISVESCTPEFFNSASNLKKLGIRGDLSLLFNESSGSIDSLGKMEHIEKLELINVYPLPSSEKPLRGLPQHHQFPYGLMSLTLRATFLSWDAMSTLALLNKLEVLKLKQNAVMGETWNWNAVDGGFKCLQLLHIEDTDLIIWEASALCYLKLRSLVLRNCEKLLEIPNGIADIPSLQTLELYKCRSAAASAKAIKEAKKKTQPEGSPFMLSIY